MEFIGSSEWMDSGSRMFEAEGLTADKAADGSFSLRFINCGLSYTAVLKPSENEGVVVGSWQVVGVPRRTGPCVVRVYESVNGETILLGSWTEAGTRYDWFTKLKQA